MTRNFLALSLFTLLLSSSAIAESTAYQLTLGLQVPGEKKMNAQVIVKDGEKGEVTQKTKRGHTFVEVTPTEGTYLGKSGILMKFVVGTIDRKGVRTILSEPEVLVGEDQPARLNVSKKNGKKELTLSVTATRKTAPEALESVTD